MDFEVDATRRAEANRARASLQPLFTQRWLSAACDDSISTRRRRPAELCIGMFEDKMEGKEFYRYFVLHLNSISAIVPYACETPNLVEVLIST